MLVVSAKSFSMYGSSAQMTRIARPGPKDYTQIKQQQQQQQQQLVTH